MTFPRAIAKNLPTIYDKIFFVFLGFYALGIVAFARYGFNMDDAFFFIDIVVFDGFIINGASNTGEGRYYPLAFTELNVLPFFGDSPYIFFGFNALVVVVIGAILWNLLTYFSHNKPLNLAISAVCFLNPAFITIMLGISYPEKILIVFLLVFVYISVRIYRGERRILVALCGILSVNLALYYKEPVCAMIGAIALYNLTLRDLGRFERWYYRIVLLSVGTFLAVYVFSVMPQMNNLYNVRRMREFDAFEVFFNEPFLLVGLPLLLVARAVSAIKHIAKSEAGGGSISTIACY